VFVSSLATALTEYSIRVVQFVVDPRTGIITEFPNGLPNVGQIEKFCDHVEERQERQRRLAQLPRYQPSQPIAAPPRTAGQFSHGEFLEWARANGVKPRAIGRFEE
jgi:hypothetical protein